MQEDLIRANVSIALHKGIEMFQKMLKSYKKFGDVSTPIRKLAFDSIFYFYIKEFLGKQHMLKFYDNDNDKFYNLFIQASIDWNLAIRYFSREILKKKEIKRVTLIFPINQSQFFYIQKEEKKKRNTHL